MILLHVIYKFYFFLNSILTETETKTCSGSYPGLVRFMCASQRPMYWQADPGFEPRGSFNLGISASKAVSKMNLFFFCNILSLRNLVTAAANKPIQSLFITSDS